jgi:hypothetical protein
VCKEELNLQLSICMVDTFTINRLVNEYVDKASRSFVINRLADKAISDVEKKLCKEYFEGALRCQAHTELIEYIT